MKILRLYIENFMCYNTSFIDFTKFNSAVIIGKMENNDLFSNGVGKTTIFKAIEYVLFNQADVNLENIIRDDVDSCQIILDFAIDSQEYRVSRKRTKKGSSDLSLFKRTAVKALDEEIFSKKTNDKLWKDISGRRAADTEKELNKFIKINFKAFRSTIHFIQNDFLGLPTVSPEKRKGILKDALNLIIYTKLEKIAKETFSSLNKEIEKNKILIDNIGDPEKELLNFYKIQKDISFLIEEKTNQLTILQEENNSLSDNIQKLNNEFSILESKSSSFILQEKLLLNEKSKIETSVKEYTTKKNNVIALAKDLISEIQKLQDEQSKLSIIDYSKADNLLQEISFLTKELSEHNIIISARSTEYDKLKIPLPNDNICRHCRQTLSDKHKIECKNKIDLEIKDCLEQIKKSKQFVSDINIKIKKLQIDENNIRISKQNLENISLQIINKNKELKDKKEIHIDYSDLLNRFTNELKNKEQEILLLQEEIKNSSFNESQKIQQQINDIKSKLEINSNNIAKLNKELLLLKNNEAVNKHNIDQQNKNISTIISLKKSLIELESKNSIYAIVLQAFSSSGIPNLIIQNVLDEFQVEANNLLSQLKPGIQLSFKIEKTVEKTGDQEDTLDIVYQINGRNRYYEQLSGAQKLAVTFSLKLGLSFLLQKMLGIDIKMLLLDEVDQSLDKASIDAFSDIIKFFQKDFTILVISHNDRLKDKFSTSIVVEQNTNLVSTTKIIYS